LNDPIPRKLARIYLWQGIVIVIGIIGVCVVLWLTR
jgi:hypothetical protein